MILLLLFPIVAGCRKAITSVADYAIKLEYGIDIGDGTKAEPASKVEVENINIFLYQEDGMLADCDYSTSATVSLSIDKKKKYKVYAIANIGDITHDPSLVHESGILSYDYSFPELFYHQKTLAGIPMCYCSKSHIPIEDKESLPIPLTRCVTEINLKIDRSRLNVGKFVVLSASIKNVPKKTSFFTPYRISSEEDSYPQGCTLPYSSLSKVYTEGVSFISGENAQGTLLEENSTQSSKVFDADSPYRKTCTYIELVISYRSMNMYGDSLIYRYYLGEDCYSNFDVLRNKSYNIVVTPINTGINENSWRVDVSNLRLVASRASITIPLPHSSYEGYSQKITPIIFPREASLLPLQWSIVKGDEYVSISQEGVITGKKRGKAVIQAALKDYPEVSATSEVEIRPAVTISTPYLELMNYSLWPEMEGSGYPSTASLNVDVAPNATIEWIVTRYGGQREDISVTRAGEITLGPLSSGHYTIQAKASTGDYYSDGYACADVYYFLMYQDTMHDIAGYLNRDGTCNVKVSMGTRWHKERIPSGTFSEMTSKKIIIDSRDNTFTRKSIGEDYIFDEVFRRLTFDKSLEYSAYKNIKPLSYAFETIGNYGIGARFRYDTGDWNYYYVKRDDEFYNNPTL